jgi:hypothetical protein
MKKLFILALVAFFAFLPSSSVIVAQERKAVEKKVDTVISTPITGKVTQADEKTKTVTISGKGGEKVTVNFSNSKAGTCKVRSRVSEPKTFPRVGNNAVARATICEDCLSTC